MMSMNTAIMEKGMKMAATTESASKERGQRAKKLRESHGLTMSQLAARIGVDMRTIARWEAHGTSEQNLERVMHSLELERASREGKSAESSGIDLSGVSTLDLALELAQRARAWEDRDRKINTLMDRAIDNSMEWILPPGL